MGVWAVCVCTERHAEDYRNTKYLYTVCRIDFVDLVWLQCKGSARLGSADWSENDVQ